MVESIPVDSSRWGDFIEVCRGQEVAERAIRWYVLRVERYLQAHPDLPLALHSGTHVDSYLEKAGRSTALSAWQFRQLVHALQLLFVRVVRAPWSTEFHWQYWLDSAQALEHDHPTVARHNQPLERNDFTSRARPAGAVDDLDPDIVRQLVECIRK